MKRRVIIRDVADAEIDQIARSIARHDLSAGLRFYDAIEESCKLLARFPRLGRRRIAKDPALRELRSWLVKGFRNYLIFYLPLKSGVEVLHVVHGARDLGQLLGVE
ncbi:MAG TPA: type II toxin-antitoxin system RelE/ParE family toxin [Tepidisphaeraceae bacterium]|jgi:toxin ParE1/3/4